jgi:hypothetical protein
MEKCLARALPCSTACSSATARPRPSPLCVCVAAQAAEAEAAGTGEPAVVTRRTRRRRPPRGRAPRRRSVPRPRPPRRSALCCRPTHSPPSRRLRVWPLTHVQPFCACMQMTKNVRVYAQKSLAHAVIYSFLVKEAACRPRTTSTPSTLRTSRQRRRAARRRQAARSMHRSARGLYLGREQRARAAFRVACGQLLGFALLEQGAPA